MCVGGGVIGVANNNGSLISAFVIRLLELYRIYTCYRPNFNYLASLCNCTDWFEYYLVDNPEDRVSHVATRLA